MKKLSRREFLGAAAAGCLACGLPGPAFPASGRVEIGECKSVLVTCVSEPAYWDRKIFLRNMWQGGGPGCDQWTTPWNLDNGAGFCALLQIEDLDGKRRNLLFDTGWNPDYMARRFRQTGLDRLLRGGKIDGLVISHEHADHFWGLEAVLRLAPEIDLLVPATLGPRGREFIGGRSFAKAGAINRIKHRGRLRDYAPGKVHCLAPGVGLAGFDLPLGFKARGEQSLICNIKDKGLLLVSGCCHQTMAALIQYARDNLAGERIFYGLYGGLHLAPFNNLGPLQEQRIRDLARHGFRKIACNHCTGRLAVELMRNLGYPVVTGNGARGRCLGNGERVFFG